MKSSIGNVWITGLVITFMLIFCGYLAVTISYSSTIKEKNYILSIIEKKNGITKIDGVATTSSLRKDTKVYNGFGSLETINLFLRGSAYKQKWYCNQGKGDASGKDPGMSVKWYGVKNLYSKDAAVTASGSKAQVNVQYEAVKKTEKYYYCFAKILVNPSLKSSQPTPAYYRIRMFYALELPILDSLIFTIDGKTDIIEKPSKCEIKQFRTGNPKC